MNTSLFLVPLAAILAATLLAKLYHRLQLSRAKHPSLRGHSKWGARVAKLIRGYEYSDTEVFSIDGAPPSVAERRSHGFFSLSAKLSSQAAGGLELTSLAKRQLSDLQFTSAYRVPFQFRSFIQRHLPSSAFISDAQGVTVTDLDGNSFYDIAGSYGVNVFGHDFYVQNMRSAVEQAAPLGMTLGAYHPVVANNAKRLAAISGMDEVSFHMSGTEAVMQAVRLARYHTKRTHLVRFCGAYHGWWGDVQPGIGNPQVARETYTLKDMDADTLHVLRTRKDIACVLVNPIQALHPNGNSPSDGQLVNSSRSAAFDKEAYGRWLAELRRVCTERGIALIFDEVFLGFRLAKRGAQEYFGIEADLVTYGKTLGGGFPVGVLCGKDKWMRRFRPERPVDVCFARGTFNSHPAVMTAMDGFLRYIETDEATEIYATAESAWNRRATYLNECLRTSNLPVRIANLQSVFTVFYTAPARYNWLFQYYLRDQGLALSWVGTGRFVFSLNYTEAEFEEVAHRIVRAASLMQRDGFWWQAADVSNKSISRALIRELWQRGVRRAVPPLPQPEHAVPAED